MEGDTLMIHDAELDELFPPRGPCAMCGHPDARHRLWDVIIDSPDTAGEIAYNYGVSLSAVEAVRRIRPYAPSPTSKSTDNG